MDDESPDAEGRLRDLERGMRIIICAPAIAASIFPLWMLSTVGRFATIFEDMLGAGKKLPDVTLFVMAFQRPIFGTVLVWAGFCIWAACAMKTLTRAAIVCVIGFLTFLAIGVTVWLAMWAPLTEIIKQMQGGV